MKSNIVIIPSAVSPRMGVFTSQERYEQTVQTIASIREKIENPYIIINDISLEPAGELKQQLANLVDVFIDSEKDPNALYFSKNGLKSPGELILFGIALSYVREKLNIDTINRIYKVGARVKLKPNFQSDVHTTAGTKFVFKSLPSWMKEDTKLYITRLWSMPPSAINMYMETLPRLMECFSQGYDTEHAHYICFKNNTKEIDSLCVECKIAPNGSLHED